MGAQANGCIVPKLVDRVIFEHLHCLSNKHKGGYDTAGWITQYHDENTATQKEAKHKKRETDCGLFLDQLLDLKPH